MPTKSNDSDGDGSSLASTRQAAISATMPIGTLMKKIQCQLAVSISQPPRIGPKIGPSSMGTPSTAITRPIRCGPAAWVMIVMPSGISMPPPSPCSTRKLISEPMLQARPQAIEPSRNRDSASMYSRLVPNRRSEEHTSELQSRRDLVCRLLLEKKKQNNRQHTPPPGARPGINDR